MTEEQTVGAVFRQVSPLVVVRTTEKDFGLEGDGLHVKAIPGLGSGVLVSSGGKVITAAHVVQTADEIFVQFLGGEVAKGRVIASEPERSEEHTSELQSLAYLVCRLLLEKKKNATALSCST